MNDDYLKFSLKSYYIPPMASQEDVIKAKQVAKGKIKDTSLSQESLKNAFNGLKIIENACKIGGYKNAKKLTKDLKLAKKWIVSQRELVDSLDVSMKKQQQENNKIVDEKTFWKEASNDLIPFVAVGRIVDRFDIINEIASAIHLPDIVVRSLNETFETSLQHFVDAKLEAKVHVKGLNFAKSLKAYNKLNDSSTDFERNLAALSLIKSAFQFAFVTSRVLNTPLLVTAALAIVSGCLGFLESRYQASENKEEGFVFKYDQLHNQLSDLIENQFKSLERSVAKLPGSFEIGMVEDLKLDRESYRNYLSDIKDPQHLLDLVISYRHRCLDTLEFNGIDVREFKRELEVFLESLLSLIFQSQARVKVCQESLESQLIYLKDKKREYRTILKRLKNNEITLKAPRRTTLDVISDTKKGISQLRAKQKHIESLLLEISPTLSENQENLDDWVRRVERAISNEELDRINEIVDKINIDFETYSVIEIT